MDVEKLRESEANIHDTRFDRANQAAGKKGEGKMRLGMYRQGDVLFIQIDQIPKVVTEQKQGVLVEGEVTGHAHRIAPADLPGARIFRSDGNGPQRLFVQAISQLHIVHEEHGTIQLPPGQYEVIRQREYSPSEIRNVTD